MPLSPFDKPGRFFRGGLHTHCTRSDGRRSPEAVIDAYRALGYDFLALTDHFQERYQYPITDTRQWRDTRFTTLLGAELHAPALANGETWHLLAVGLPLDFAPPTPGEDGPALATRAAAAGAYVAIAHPAWYGLTLTDALAVAEVSHAVEVINYGSALETQRGDSWHLFDQLLQLGWRLTACATDDAHFVETMPPDWGGAWVEVRAAALDPDHLLTALKAGDYCSSEGPRLDDLSLDGDRLVVTCSPARAIHVTGPAARAVWRWGDQLTSAELPITRFRGGYCRVTIVDTAGKRAWSNPIWLDE